MFKYSLYFSAMLEIIALIFLSKKVGHMAEQKGLKPSTWKLYNVLAWVSVEILVIFIMLLVLGKDLSILAALFGIGAGYCSHLLIIRSLNNMPDAESELDALASHIIE